MLCDYSRINRVFLQLSINHHHGQIDVASELNSGRWDLPAIAHIRLYIVPERCPFQVTFLGHPG